VCWPLIAIPDNAHTTNSGVRRGWSGMPPTHTPGFAGAKPSFGVPKTPEKHSLRALTWDSIVRGGPHLGGRFTTDVAADPIVATNRTFSFPMSRSLLKALRRLVLSAPLLRDFAVSSAFRGRRQ